MAQVTIKQLEAFTQVARLGSFRRAAERLHTTQPSISARIASLESQLGLKLMNRDAGSVRLTPVGEVLLTKAQAVLHSLEAFMVTAGDDHLFEGTLRLGVTEMIVHAWLSRFLGALRERFENIDVDLTVDLSVNLSPSLFGRTLDLALQSGPFPHATSGSLDLGSFPWAWVASPGLGCDGRALSFDAFIRHPILTPGHGTLAFQQLQDHLAGAAAGARVVPSSNIAACLQMSLEGLGVACLPAVMVREAVRAGHLVLVDYEWRPDPLSFSARFDAESAPHHVRQAAHLAQEVSLAYLREAS